MSRNRLTAKAAEAEVLRKADTLADAALDPSVPQNGKMIEHMTKALVNAVLDWRQAVYAEMES